MKKFEILDRLRLMGESIAELKRVERDLDDADYELFVTSNKKWVILQKKSDSFGGEAMWSQ